MAHLCENFPCHPIMPEGFLCEFCKCPEFFDPKCSGNPKWEKVGKTEIKDCSECIVPHTPEYVKKNYHILNTVY